MKITSPLILKYFAVLTCVHGLQPRPLENQKKKVPQSQAFREAVNHLDNLDVGGPKIGVDTVKITYSKFVIGHEDAELLSSQYLKKVVSLGQWVAGDEKLFKWTGESGWLRMCLNKDDYIGFWNYMLTARLPTGKVFLIHIIPQEDTFLAVMISLLCSILVTSLTALCTIAAGHFVPQMMFIKCTTTTSLVCLEIL